MRDPVKESFDAIENGEITRAQVKAILREYAASALSGLRLGDLEGYLRKFDRVREENKQAAKKAQEAMYDFAKLYAITTEARNILGYIEYAKIMQRHCGHMQASLVRVQDVNRVIAALQDAMVTKHARCETITPKDEPHTPKGRYVRLTEGGRVGFVSGERVYSVYVRSGITYVSYEVAQS